MCRLCPIIHLQYEDALLPRRSRTRDEKLGSLSARVPLTWGGAARPDPSQATVRGRGAPCEGGNGKPGCTAN